MVVERALLRALGKPWWCHVQCMPAGQEPYRKLGIRVNIDPMISPEQCKLVLETQDVFWKYYIEVIRIVLAHRLLTSEPNFQSYCVACASVLH